MLKEEDKKILEKLKEFSDLDKRLNNLIEKYDRNVEYPKKFFDKYIEEEKHKLEKEVKEKKEHLNRREKKIEQAKGDLRERKNSFIKEKNKEEKLLKKKKKKTNNHLEAKKKRLQRQFEEKEKKLKEDIERISKEKSEGFPWLAEAYADFSHLREMKLANYLESKKHPAKKSAERLREISKKKRIIEKKFRVSQNIINYYQNLFPFLEEFIGGADEEVLKQILNKNIDTPINEVNETGVDPVKIYLSKEEYNKLSTVEKNQLALDRYWKRNKSSWEVGKDYERYVGYLYEQEGYNVYYQGILEGFSDLGRDLICKKDNKTLVVQCKRWSLKKKKFIREAHINQLYGTTIKYKIDNPDENVVPIMYTSTKLSKEAKEFADYLDVKIKDQIPFKKYPSIKCNISQRTGEKIYHLPFDQQYDNTIIEEEKSECYVETVAEAEEKGFRRAWKWQGKDN